jgi:hypothetical protein
MQVQPKDQTEITPAGRRAEIMALQQYMQEQPDQIQPPVLHHFAPGMYGREILLPAGSLTIGKIHKHAHLNVISMGKCRVLTEDGTKTFEAPYTFVSKPGTKRVVYAITDVVWTTCHLANSTDLEEIEAEVIAPSYEALELSATHLELSL